MNGSRSEPTPGVGTTGCASVRRVAVGYDASGRSQDAMRLGRILATALDAQLLVAVVDEASVAQGSPGESLARKSLYSHVGESARQQATGVRLLEERSNGSTAGALRAVADREDVDVLVVGPTHVTDLGRIADGSVGDRLLRESSCALAVAPLGYRDHRAPLRRIGFIADHGVVEVPPSELADLVAEATGAHLESKAFDPQAASPAETLAELSAELDLLVIPAGALGDHRRELISAPPCPVIVTPPRRAEA